MPALEWVQCRGCGRRHRWRVDLANTDVTCACGSKVHLPDLKAFEASAARDAEGLSDASSLIVVNAPEQVEAGRLREYHGRGPGLWGMSSFATFLFWLALAMLGFSFAVHAALLQYIWSYVGSALFVPVPFFKTWQWYKRWLHGRTLSQAIDEQLNRPER